MAAATFNYFPFDTGPGANSDEVRWGEMLSWMRTTGILTVNPPPLSAVGDCAVAPDVAMQIQVYDGTAWMQGFYFAHTNDPFPIVISPNSSGDPRIDLVTLQLDLINNEITYFVVEGTPDPSPVAPLPQQDADIWQFPLAEVTVADGAIVINIGDISDVRVPSIQGNTGSSAIVAGAGITITYSGNNIIISSP
jgi:hypothetical protein